MANNFHDEEFQKTLLAYLWRKDGVYVKYEESFSPSYFDSSVNVSAYGLLSSYFKTYRKMPSLEVVMELVRVQYPGESEDDVRKRAAQCARFEEFVALDISDDKFIELKVREFTQYKAMYEFVVEAFEGVKTKKYDPELPKKARLALSKGEEAFDKGLEWTDGAYSRVIEYYQEDSALRIPTNLTLFDEHVRQGGMRGGELGIILALPKGFKCSSPDKENLMYDGTIKRSRDIKVGDLLMGDDSTPREVLEVGSGRGQMYRVTQANGDSYEVTGDHVLCLKQLEHQVSAKCGQFLEMTVEEYSKQTLGFQRRWKGYKVGVDFPSQPVNVDPYFVGLWLGGGCYSLTSSLRSIGLTEPVEGGIPRTYKINDRGKRLSLLAGLMDGAGRYVKSIGFIFINSNRTLCEDICWLARSLGFRSHITGVKSYRVMIQGKLSEIPTKLPRKGGKDSPKASERTTLTVEKIGVGDWCGFLLNGNHRYLFSDFTVTHNSGTMLNFAYGGLKHFYQHSTAFKRVEGGASYNMLYFTLELSSELIASRFDRCCLGWDIHRIIADPVGAAKSLESMQQFLGGRLFIKQYASRTASCDTLREYIDRMYQQYGIKFCQIFVDYLDLLKMSGSMGKNLREDSIATAICEDLRAVAIEYGIPIWTACRATREAVGAPFVSMKHMSKSFERIGVADQVIAVCQSEEEKQKSECRIVPVASRNDGEGKQLNCTIDYPRMRLYCNEAVDIEYEAASKSGKAATAFASKGMLKSGKNTQPTGELAD